MLVTKTNVENEKIDIDPKNLEVSFDKETTPTETKEEETKPKAIKVSMGKDSGALAEEKSKPKKEQDKEKIKQLEKSIKDRKKEIENKVGNNKKYKPNENPWNGVIDDENEDDWSYIANGNLYQSGGIPQIKDFEKAAQTKIDNANHNTSKDREYYLNLPAKGFDEWLANQENPDELFITDRYKKEREEWLNNVKVVADKYGAKDLSTTELLSAYYGAKEKGDYDAAVMLYQAISNAMDSEKAKTEKSTKTSTEVKEETPKTETSKTETPKAEEILTKESAWEKYNSKDGTAGGLFKDFMSLGMSAEEARKEFLSKKPNPSPAAKQKFIEFYDEPLIKTTETSTEVKEETPKNNDFKVGGTQRKTYNEAQSETAKNIKDLLMDETYQTLTDDEKRDALKKATEKALNKYSSSFIDKANTRENAAQLSKFLPRFAIQHFLEGNFGDKKDPKSWGTLGYFLLDKVGKSLVNASQVARGLSPTERTALENYNETMMKNAFGRDDENRKRVLNSSLDALVKDSDVLREVGISDFKIFDDFTEKVLTQYQDNIQGVNLDKILKEKSDFILNMPNEEQQKFIGYLIAMNVSEPGSAAYLNAAYRAADMEQRFAKTDAEKYAAQKSKTEINLKLAGMEVNNRTLFAQLDSIELKNEKDRATMAAEIDRVVRENEKLIEDIKKARTENSYLAREKEKELEQKVANIVSTYASVGTNTANTVANILDALIPG